MVMELSTMCSFPFYILVRELQSPHTGRRYSGNWILKAETRYGNGSEPPLEKPGEGVVNCESGPRGPIG